MELVGQLILAPEMRGARAPLYDTKESDTRGPCAQGDIIGLIVILYKINLREHIQRMDDNRLSK